MGIAAQGMADKDGVVPRGRQRSVGFVGDADSRELPSAIEGKGAGEIDELGFDHPDRARDELDIGVRPRHEEIILVTKTSPAGWYAFGAPTESRAQLGCR